MSTPNNIEPNNLIRVAKEAASALQGNPTVHDLVLNRVTVENNHPIQLYPKDVSKVRKVELMSLAHNVVSNYDSLISQVEIGLADTEQHILIANSEGLFVEDQRVRTRLMIQAVASKGNEKQSGFYILVAMLALKFGPIRM